MNQHDLNITYKGPVMPLKYIELLFLENSHILEFKWYCSTILKQQYYFIDPFGINWISIYHPSSCVWIDAVFRKWPWANLMSVNIHKYIRKQNQKDRG